MAAPLLVAAAPAAISGLASIFGGKQQSRSVSNAAQQQTQANNYAADLEAQSAQDALAFAREQEEQRKREWEMAQERNWQVYLQQREDLAPYRQLGAGSIAQMARPIYSKPKPGSIGALAGR